MDDKIENLLLRISDLDEMIEAKHLKEQQKHLLEGIERDYWHYGYVMALKDVVRNFNLTEKA